MTSSDVWYILGIVSGILLLAYWNRRNALWGGLTIGGIIGFIVSLFYQLELSLIAKGAILGVMAGFASEFFYSTSKNVANKTSDYSPGEEIKLSSKKYLSNSLKRKPTEDEILGEVISRLDEMAKIAKREESGQLNATEASALRDEIFTREK